MWGNPLPEGAHVYNDRVAATLGWSGEDGVLLIWHRAPGKHEWLATRVTLHDVTPVTEQADLASVTVSPSILWPDCCGTHGFLTNGVWCDA